MDHSGARVLRWSRVLNCCVWNKLFQEAFFKEIPQEGREMRCCVGERPSWIVSSEKRAIVN